MQLLQKMQTVTDAPEEKNHALRKLLNRMEICIFFLILPKYIFYLFI